MVYTHHYESPLGGITLASDGESLIGLWFDEQKYFADVPEAQHMEKDLVVFEQADHWLDVYFSGHKPGFTPPLRMKTTVFRKVATEIPISFPAFQARTKKKMDCAVTNRRMIPTIMNNIGLFKLNSIFLLLI